jgi:hypothetical protein
MDSNHYLIHPARVIKTPGLKIDFLCCILCGNIIWQPEKCKFCHTHFCKFCIVFSLLKTKKCLQCLNEYNPSSPDSFLVEDLKELQIICQNKIHGCNASNKYTTILKHESDCIYREINCQDCNNKILKKDFHTHMIICKSILPKDFFIDYRQVIVYFNDKLEKVENENLVNLEKLKKSLTETLSQNELKLQNIFLKMEKQKKQVEDLIYEREKHKSQSNEESKFFEEIKIYNSTNSKTESKNSINEKNIEILPSSQNKGTDIDV